MRTRLLDQRGQQVGVVADHFPRAILFAKDVRGPDEDGLRYSGRARVHALLIIAGDREFCADGDLHVIADIKSAPWSLPCAPAIPDAPRVTPSEQLCLACGMCCDGTLFDGVQLERGDSAKRLRALGLPIGLSQGQKPVGRFSQPCAALCEDRTCHIYQDRPRQCRTFECQVFKDANTGRIEFPAAQRLVEKTRRQADRARRLLFRLGETDEYCSLGERFHRMQCRMETDAPDAAALALFADLSLAVHKLKLVTQAKFYPQSDEPDSP